LLPLSSFRISSKEWKFPVLLFLKEKVKNSDSSCCVLPFAVYPVPRINSAATLDVVAPFFLQIMHCVHRNQNRNQPHRGYFEFDFDNFQKQLSIHFESNSNMSQGGKHRVDVCTSIINLKQLEWSERPKLFFSLLFKSSLNCLSYHI
jgi:hypothetical protein